MIIYEIFIWLCSSIIAVCMIICAIAEFWGFESANDNTEYLVKQSIWKKDFDSKYEIKDPLQFDD